MSDNMYYLQQAAVFRLNQFHEEAEREREAKQVKRSRFSLKNALGKGLVSLGLKLANQPQRV